MSMSIIDNFKFYMDEISKWNAICENKTSTREEAFETQLNVTIEECKETILAILQNDKKEILDGIADVIVTAGYLAKHFANCEFDNEDLEFTYDAIYGKNQTTDSLFYPVSVLIDLINDEKNNIGANISPFDLTWPASVYFIGYEIYGSELDDYICAVLKSNNTKFIPEDIFKQEDLDYCQQKYGDKFENIVSVKTEYEGKNYFVIRANNGTGKILKPSYFREPDYFL